MSVLLELLATSDRNATTRKFDLVTRKSEPDFRQCGLRCPGSTARDSGSAMDVRWRSTPACMFPV